MRLNIKLDALNPSQRLFVASEALQVLMAGGFGSGKTTALALKILQLKSINRGVDGLVIAQTFGSIDAVVLATLRDVFRRAGIDEQYWPQHRNKGSGKDWLDFGDGDKVHLRSAETPKGMDGLNVGWVCGDEIRHWPRVAYEIAIGRRRQKCPMPQSAFASTPAMHWMAEEFNTQKEGRELIRAPTIENAPHLIDGFVDNLRQSYSPRVQRAVLDGEFTIMEGAVFEEFDPNPETSEWMLDVVPDLAAIRKCKIYLAADPGFRHSAWIWLAQVGHLEWLAFDEAMLDNHSDEAAARIVNERGWPIDEVWIDPAANNTQSGFGIDTLRILRNAIKTRQPSAFRSVDTYRDIRFGVEKLRVLLGGYQRLPRRIRFTRKMARDALTKQRGIVKDLGALRYPEHKDGHPVTDLPLKDGITDHACLVGCTKVFTEDSGWRSLDELAGSRSRILTPDGLRRISALGVVRRQERVWEICFASGETTVATGDHPFIISARCYCGRELADFSWATVLQMRALLQQINKSRQGVSASRGMGGCKWCGAGQNAYSPRGREHEQQHAGESTGDDADKTPLTPHHKKSAQGIVGCIGSGGNVAQIKARARVAFEARQGCVGKPNADGLYMPRLWSQLSVVEARRGEVLPSKLQSHCATQAARNSSPQRIADIRIAGTADVWCASVPGTGAFVLEDGTVSGNTDALRYFAVSRWLCEPELRKIDPEIKDAAPGYKIYMSG